jgi:hypothetical protein
MPRQASLLVPALGALLLAAPAHADDSDPALECLAKPTLPLPTCVPAQGPEEHTLVTLQRAQAWVRAEQFALAARSLAECQRRLAGSADVGLLVRVRSLEAEAWLGLSQTPAAEAAFRAAFELWASERALSWIRQLPSGEASQRSIQQASDAAARAVLLLAESHWRMPAAGPPPFARAAAPQPFAPRRDTELSPQQRAIREAWAKGQRAAFLRHYQEQIAPWLVREHASLEAAEREFEQVYLVPPVAAPPWRVAVAANIGFLWGRFMVWQRAIDASCGVACDEVRTNAYYGTFDDSWEPDRQRARSAFEACIALSRKYRVLSEYTLACESWLAQNFRSDHASEEELMPTAHWATTEPIPASAPSPR